MPGRVRLLDLITMVQLQLCHDAWQIIDYLVFTVDTRVIPIWNALGVIPGYITNEVVLVGNHRDGKTSSIFMSCPSLIDSISSLGKVKSTFVVVTSLKLGRSWEPRILPVERLLSMKLFVGWAICCEKVGVH